uniref:Cx9C motif-containing protein 4 n=1 Tax=Oryza rufipogon TaxID=4529 RepID=A0A0E0REN4_ORYRU
MAQQSKEPCKKEACDIQACLSKNMFDSKKCVRVIQLLQSCCEQCEYKSTHCDDSGGSNKPVLSLKKMNGVLMAELFCA